MGKKLNKESVVEVLKLTKEEHQKQISNVDSLNQKAGTVIGLLSVSFTIILAILAYVNPSPNMFLIYIGLSLLGICFMASIILAIIAYDIRQWKTVETRITEKDRINSRENLEYEDTAEFFTIISDAYSKAIEENAIKIEDKGRLLKWSTRLLILGLLIMLFMFLLAGINNIFSII